MCDDHKHDRIHKDVKKRYGSAIEHGEGHTSEHKQWNRRDFLQSTGLLTVGGSVMLSKFPVSAFSPSPLMSALNSSETDRVLVLLRFSGGNDGLNMVVPRSNDEYFNIRPNIALGENDIWNISDDSGIANEMIDLQPMWDAGQMKVLHNVGYTRPNYSHFRSSDIWATGTERDVYKDTGWIGTALGVDYPAFLDAPPLVPPALQIGIQTNLIFQGEQASLALAISNPSEFYQIAQSGQLYDTSSLGSCTTEDELKFVRQKANSAFRYAESIQAAYGKTTNEVAYPNNSLAEQFAILARLIKGNLGTKVYLVSIGGFDTHSNQIARHSTLMSRIGSSVKAFYDDLATQGYQNKVLTASFSEFSRTIFENGSEGTDHGTGGPMFLFGGENLGQEILGSQPDLLNLDQYGDPIYEIDFKSVYASILEDWLNIDPAVVTHTLTGVTKIDGLVPTTQDIYGSNRNEALLGYNSHRDYAGVIELKYSLSTKGNVRLLILDKAGHELRMLVNDFVEKGSYIFDFKPEEHFLPSGEYIVQLDTGGKRYNRKINW